MTSLLWRRGRWRTWLRVLRVLLRRARRAGRDRAQRSTWWTHPVTAGDLELRPAYPADADAWQRLVVSDGPGPVGAGIAASPLGGTASDRAGWVENCLDLQAKAGRNLAYPYLIRLDGELVGEALGFVDYGTSAAEVLVWLGRRFATPQRQAACADLLARHVLSAPGAPGRALTYVDVTATATIAALVGLGFTPEGQYRDPPRSDRAVLVLHGSDAVRPDATAHAAAVGSGAGAAQPARPGVPNSDI